MIMRLYLIHLIWLMLLLLVVAEYRERIRSVSDLPLSTNRRMTNIRYRLQERGVLSESPSNSPLICRLIHGYEWTGSKCEDINECETGANDCVNGGCENFAGGYRCVPIGNEENYPGTQENDYYTEPGGYCELHGSPCGKYGSCISDGPYHFRCECKEGFQYRYGKCGDINECKEESLCPDNSVCNNYSGGYSCKCNEGYTKASDVCKDINECDKDNICPEHSTCENYDGGYTCKCNEGYTKASGMCKDINECEKDNVCPKRSTCKNYDGGYYCKCNEGYTKISNICKDINECDKDNICPEHSTCENYNGDYECKCNEGYIKASGRCKDINECDKDNICPEHSTCENYDGGYTCKCNEGYTKASGMCKDINECEKDNVCPKRSTCKNYDGGYYCKCNEGYTKASGMCKDINECEKDNICPEHSTCENHDGDYSCECHSGYYELDKICQKKLTFCEVSKENPCGIHGVCKGTSETDYVCECNSGFSGEKICEDVNECLAQGVCDLHSDCLNELGGFSCICIDGYEKLLSGICKPINPCDNDSGNRCGTGGVCISTAKFEYRCECNAGYMLDSGICIDIDECIESDCGEFGSCINKDGGFACSCNTGYEEKEGKCQLVDACLDYQCYENSYCMVLNNLPTCTCKNGFVGNEEGNLVCVDINECDIEPLQCPPEMKCINTLGSFSCECKDGFHLFNGVCIEIGPAIDGFSTPRLGQLKIKESYLNGSPIYGVKSVHHCAYKCSNRIECISFDYSYKLRRCYLSESKGIPIVNEFYIYYERIMQPMINPCRENPCQVNSTCLTSEDKLSRTCICDEGFVEVDSLCVPNQYCERALCHANATCSESSDGTSYSCVCNEGFLGDGSICVSVPNSHIPGSGENVEPEENCQCNEHGTCTDTGICLQCELLANARGDSCEICAPGFVGTSLGGAICTPQNEFDIVLAMDMTEFESVAPIEEQKKRVSVALASVLNVAVWQIVVLRFSEGSVVVSFYVRPSIDTALETTPEEIVQLLEQGVESLNFQLDTSLVSIKSTLRDVENPRVTGERTGESDDGGSGAVVGGAVSGVGIACGGGMVALIILRKRKTPSDSEKNKEGEVIDASMKPVEKVHSQSPIDKTIVNHYEKSHESACYEDLHYVHVKDTKDFHLFIDAEKSVPVLKSPRLSVANVDSHRLEAQRKVNEFKGSNQKVVIAEEPVYDIGEHISDVMQKARHNL